MIMILSSVYTSVTDFMSLNPSTGLDYSISIVDYSYVVLESFYINSDSNFIGSGSIFYLSLHRSKPNGLVAGCSLKSLNFSTLFL